MYEQLDALWATEHDMTEKIACRYCKDLVLRTEDRFADHITKKHPLVHVSAFTYNCVYCTEVFGSKGRLRSARSK
jgi:hypothetical protein